MKNVHIAGLVIALIGALVADAIDCHRAQVLRKQVAARQETIAAQREEIASLERLVESTDELNYSEMTLLSTISIEQGVTSGVRAAHENSYRPSFAVIWTNVVTAYNGCSASRKISFDPDAKDWPTNLTARGE